MHTHTYYLYKESFQCFFKKSLTDIINWYSISYTVKVKDSIFNLCKLILLTNFVL